MPQRVCSWVSPLSSLDLIISIRQPLRTNHTTIFIHLSRSTPGQRAAPDSHQRVSRMPLGPAPLHLLPLLLLRCKTNQLYHLPVSLLRNHCIHNPGGLLAASLIFYFSYSPHQSNCWARTWRGGERTGQSWRKLKTAGEGVPIVAQRLANLTSIREDTGSIPGLTQRVKDLALP